MDIQTEQQELPLEPSGDVDVYLGNAPIPPCTLGNFAEVFGMAFKYWVTEQTKHRVFNWYIKMVRYVVGKEYEILAVVRGREARVGDTGIGNTGIGVSPSVSPKGNGDKD